MPSTPSQPASYPQTSCLLIGNHDGTLQVLPPSSRAFGCRWRRRSVHGKPPGYCAQRGTRFACRDMRADLRIRRFVLTDGVLKRVRFPSPAPHRSGRLPGGAAASSPGPSVGSPPCRCREDGLPRGRGARQVQGVADGDRGRAHDREHFRESFLSALSAGARDRGFDTTGWGVVSTELPVAERRGGHRGGPPSLRASGTVTVAWRPHRRTRGGDYAATGDTVIVEWLRPPGWTGCPAASAPLTASTRGTGELVRHALDAGARHVVLAVGGSASTDGGAGILSALGGRLLDADGRDCPTAGRRCSTWTRRPVRAGHRGAPDVVDARGRRRQPAPRGAGRRGRLRTSEGGEHGGTSSCWTGR